MRIPAPVPSLRRRRLLAGILAFMLAACSDPVGPDPATVVQAIVIDAPMTHIPIGSTVQLGATARNATGEVVVGGTITWTSLQPEVASVSSVGLVEGRSAGTATITAAIGNVASTVTVQVIPGSCTTAGEGTLALNQARTGSLSASDCVNWQGVAADGYSLTLNAPTWVRITMTSDSFRPSFIIDNHQRNETFTDRERSVTIFADLDPGTYTIWATSSMSPSSPGTTGDYQLEVRQGSPRCAATEVAGSIGLGQTLAGSLAGTECVFTDSPRPAGASFDTVVRFADGYALTVNNAAQVQIEVASDDLHPVLIVTDTDMNVVADDPFTVGYPRQRLIRDLGPGTYVVWVTSTWTNLEGAYELTVTSRAPTCAANSVSGAIAVGESLTGYLSASDCILPRSDVNRAVGYMLSLAAPRSVTIEVTSSEIVDPFLLLTDSNMDVWAAQDPGDQTSPRLTYDLAEGAYIVWVTSFSGGSTGAFQLSVAEGPSACRPNASVDPEIVVGQSRTGSLTESDCLFPGSGSYANAYVLRLDEPASLQIDLRSSDFDPVLIVTDADMNIVDFDDDGGGYPNSRLARDFAAGNYFVWVVSYWSAETGAYELTVTDGPAICTVDSAVGTIAAGQTRTGWLTTTDCVFPGRGTYAQGYTFTVTAPTAVRIDLMSGEFDAYLYLTNTQMEVLSFNDDNGTGLNSTIVGNFLPGTFIFWATSYSTMETGEYQLVISEGGTTDLGGVVGADSARGKSGRAKGPSFVPPATPSFDSSRATARM